MSVRLIETYGSVAAVAIDIGRRARFEDAHFFAVLSGPVLVGGVFDGHCGDSVAKHAALAVPQILRERLAAGSTPGDALHFAFLKVDSDIPLPAEADVGATATAFVVSGGAIAAANAGDGEILVAEAGRVSVLTEMHRLTNPKERARVKLYEDAVIDGAYVCRADGDGRMPTRSLGDHGFRHVGIVPEPAVASMPVPKGASWLVCACDGLWDEMRHGEVAAVCRSLKEPKAVAERLRRIVVDERLGDDNLTVMVTKLA